MLSGSFVFTCGAWNVEMRQDSDHLSTRKELTLTLRSCTSSYDLSKPTIWHRWHPVGNPKYKPATTPRAAHGRKSAMSMLSSPPSSTGSRLDRDARATDSASSSSCTTTASSTKPSGLNGRPSTTVAFGPTAQSLQRADQDSLRTAASGRQHGPFHPKPATLPLGGQ
jgi:hypothetical protein